MNLKICKSNEKLDINEENFLKKKILTNRKTLNSLWSLRILRKV